MVSAVFLLYVLSCEAQGLLVHVRVNDVTVYVNRDASQAAFAEKINVLLAEGRNDVRIDVGLPANLTGQSPGRPGPTAEPALVCSIQRGQQGVDPGTEGNLVRYRWERVATELAPGRLTEVFRESFLAMGLRGRPRWMSAPTAEIDPLALGRLVEDFASALRERDIERAVAMQALKFQELAQALGLDTGRVEQGFRTYLQHMMSAPDWHVPVVELRRLEHTLEGGARLVRVSGQGGRPPLTVTAHGQQVPFEFTVCQLGGHWQFIR